MINKILILACSAKHYGYCVAGIVVDTGEWIRLVGSRNISNNEIPKQYMRYVSGNKCNPLDIVYVDIIERIPGRIQPENALVNLSVRPRFIERVGVDILLNYLSNDRFIYKNDNAYLDEISAIQCGCSLKLYMVNDIELFFLEKDGKSKAKVSFYYNGIYYDKWSMTDPDYYNQQEGIICQTGIILVSIPEDDYNGNYYKFVSKIFAL